MRKKYLLSYLSVTILGILLLCIIAYLKGGISFESEQARLAEILGVNVDDYPPTRYFPRGYYEQVLKPGMTIDEVHEIINGYERVLHCATYSEVYYYFSRDDVIALRIEVVYDDQLRFKELHGEENDSRTIMVFDCLAGQIDT